MAKSSTIYKTTIKASNIGPHKNLSDSLDFSKEKVAVFANNGSGKTFLSRMFRLISEPSAEKVNKILTIGEKKGEFLFKVDEIKNTGNTSEQIKISLERDHEPVIDVNTQYLFHVFNSDYVKENIEAVNYSTNGEIEGYVLGKSKIDLSKEKKRLTDLSKEIQQKGLIFKSSVKKGKDALDEVKVRKNTTEYKFEYLDVYNGKLNYTDPESFADLKAKNTMLGKMPDDLEDVSYPEIKFELEFIDELKKILTTKYTKSKFAEEFKTKISSKLSFIRSGVEVIGEANEKWNDCPFCEQELVDSAKDLIDDYVKFLNDEESKVKLDIVEKISSLKTIKSLLNKGVSNLVTGMKEFNKIKQFIPSQMNDALINYESEKELVEAINKLEVLLLEKKENIELKIKPSKFSKDIEVIMTYSKDALHVSDLNNKKIDQINQNKKNTSDEKRDLNRRLCKAKYQELREVLESSIGELLGLNSEKKKLEKEIEEKESQEKKSKKVKVTESLKYYLNSFFKDKYEFDEEQFCLKFKSELMNNNASDILSDGEKSIVAFCHYLADVHKLVGKESDYNKLFFIIDDPISSLDFHFVYSVSQIIRELQENLGMIKNRFIVFTHNLEFMSILIRNKIATDYITLSNGTLSKLKKELVMPYEEHLRDILDVSNGIPPTHTTPNSIRHVVETINRFEAPDKDLKTYLNANAVFKANEFIYSLMHDSSHGIVRVQKPYTEDMIKAGCDAVISFINGRYEGQIKQIS